MAEVKVIVKDRTIIVTINGALHLRFPVGKLLLIHSWHYDENFFIELTFRGGRNPCIVEHDKREIWLAILAGLEKVEW